METGYKNRKKKLAFAVNGQRFQFSTVEDPSITLLEFLRTRIHFTGPKLGCGEASGEPPLLLAVSVHCATKEAIKAAREEYFDSGSDGPSSAFLLKVPATLPVVKELCGLDNVEKYLEKLLPQ